MSSLALISRLNSQKKWAFFIEFFIRNIFVEIAALLITKLEPFRKALDEIVFNLIYIFYMHGYHCNKN